MFQVLVIGCTIAKIFCAMWSIQLFCSVLYTHEYYWAKDPFQLGAIKDKKAQHLAGFEPMTI